ncbi:MAG: hypothetical protein R3251_04620 [Candidatus Spechtbacterales bacterium]|nr:hypothetical protein [Candidatus Spechtbacterales bacterium]
MQASGQLTTFFRDNHKAMGLPRDFGIDRAGFTRIYAWHLPRSADDSESRSVEVHFYPDDKVLHVLARISPRDFKERYRENTQTLGILKYEELSKALFWLKNTMWSAGQYARSNPLLSIDFEEAMPGTYRSTL